MVAERWGLDIAFMLQTFGWKAAMAVVDQRRRRHLLFRRYLRATAATSPTRLAQARVPAWIVAVHLAFLVGVVAVHPPSRRLPRPVPVLPRLCEAYERYQDRR